MFNGYKGGGWHDKPAGRMALNAISIPSVPHTVRVPAELRDLVAAAVERGELAPGEVAGTLQRAMRCAGALPAVLAPLAPPLRRWRRPASNGLRGSRAPLLRPARTWRVVVPSVALWRP